MTTLLGIGAFAQLTGLSIDALRHYHEVGVLCPAQVDPRTGYRRYSLEQAERARRIAALRSLDELDRMIEEGTPMGAPRAEALRNELLDMFQAQQELGRAIFEQTKTSRPDRFEFELPADQRPAGYAEHERLAHEYAERLAAIVDEHGWPGRSLVGGDGAAAAWAIAQHADTDNDLCKRWLPLLQAAVEGGEANALHLAALTDRSCCETGRRSGTGRSSSLRGRAGGCVLPSRTASTSVAPRSACPAWTSSSRRCRLPTRGTAARRRSRCRSASPIGSSRRNEARPVRGGFPWTRTGHSSLRTANRTSECVPSGAMGGPEQETVAFNRPTSAASVSGSGPRRRLRARSGSLTLAASS